LQERRAVWESGLAYQFTLIDLSYVFIIVEVVGELLARGVVSDNCTS